MAKNSKNNLTEGSIVGSLIALSIPIVLANILQTAYQLIDTFWVGRLGAVAIAAVSLSFPIIFLMISIGGGLSIAGSILVAQYKGKGDMKKVDFISGQTIVMVTIVSALLSVIGYLFADPIMRFMGAAPDVLPQAVSYMQISFIGLVFFFGFFVFQALMRGVGDVKTPVYIVLATVILNLFLDPFFIFGFGPIPAMGVAGAAMATIGTQSIATVLGLFILFSGKYGVRLEMHDLKPNFSVVSKMFRLGFPASIDQSTRALGITVMTILTASFGTQIVASYGIGIRILSFVIIPAIGLSLATSALVGQNMGAGKIERASKISHVSIWAGFIGLTLAGILFFIFATPVVTVFIPGNEFVIAESAVFVRIMALTFGFMGAQMVISGVFSGAGNTFTSMMFSILALWILRFPLAYILSNKTPLGVRGIWWAFPIANVISLIIAFAWYMRGTWKNKRIIDEDEKMQIKIEEEAIMDEQTD